MKSLDHRMHAVVSLLDPLHSSRVEALWRELEVECGIAGFHATPLPHFSWQIAENYDWDRLESILENLAAGMEPFTVRTTGLALFTGPEPVVYLPLVRDLRLSHHHRMLWEALQPWAHNPSRYYAPGLWMPHISLAFTDVGRDNIDCLMQMLAFRTFAWAIEIDNLSLIFNPEGKVGELRYRFDFGR